jgi:hypothetical protein
MGDGQLRPAVRCPRGLCKSGWAFAASLAYRSGDFDTARTLVVGVRLVRRCP